MSTLRPNGVTIMDPELVEVVKKGPLFDPNLKFTVEQARHAFSARNKADPAGHPSVEEVDHQVSMRDGALIKIRTYAPIRSDSQPPDSRPVFVVYHGGGYIIGDLSSEALMCRLFADKFGGVAVNVEYRLAPEHPFPIPVNDAYDALKWVAANCALLNVDPSKGFLVGGVSAGAVFTSVVAHLYRDEGLSPPLTGLYLSNPAALYPGAVPAKYQAEYQSRAEFDDSPIATPHFKFLTNQSYKLDPTSPLASPFLFPSHTALPKTYLQICGRDELLDEELLYERALLDDGVVVKRDIYPGLPHIFWTYFANFKQTAKHAKDREAAIAWLLESRTEKL